MQLVEFGRQHLQAGSSFRAQRTWASIPAKAFCPRQGICSRSSHVLRRRKTQSGPQQKMTHATLGPAATKFPQRKAMPTTSKGGHRTCDRTSTCTETLDRKLSPCASVRLASPGSDACGSCRFAGPCPARCVRSMRGASTRGYHNQVKFAALPTRSSRIERVRSLEGVWSWMARHRSVTRRQFIVPAQNSPQIGQLGHPKPLHGSNPIPQRQTFSLRCSLRSTKRSLQ